MIDHQSHLLVVYPRYSKKFLLSFSNKICSALISREARARRLNLIRDPKITNIVILPTRAGIFLHNHCLSEHISIASAAHAWGPQAVHVHKTAHRVCPGMQRRRDTSTEGVGFLSEGGRFASSPSQSVGFYDPNLFHW